MQSFFCLKLPAKTEMKGDLVAGVLNYSLIKGSRQGDNQTWYIFFFPWIAQNQIKREFIF